MTEERIFIDKEKRPDDESLKDALGESFSCWQDVQDYMKVEYENIIPEWKHYGKKTGWLLKMLLKKRNMFFLVPLENKFRIVFVFGDKAVSVVEDSNLPDNLKEELRNARKYAEGRGLNFPVMSPEEVEHIKELVKVKIAN